MAALILPSRRVVQPQGPVGIDWANPLARGLAFCYLPAVPRDLVTGAATTFVNLAANYRRGSSIVFPGTDATTKVTTGAGWLLGGKSELTVFAVASTNAALTDINGTATDGLIGAGGNAIYSERSASGNDILKLTVASVSGTEAAPEFTYRDDGGTLKQLRISGYDSKVRDGRPHAYALRKASNIHSVFFDGVFASESYSGTTSFTNASPTRCIGHDVADSNSQWNGSLDIVVGWSRALTDTELMALCGNPWQLLRPVQRRVWVPVGVELVGADSSGTYAVLHSVGQDASGSYSIVSPVGSDVLCSHSVLAAAGANAVGGYACLAAAGADLAQIYGVTAVAGADASCSYGVAGAVGASLGGGFDVLQAAAADENDGYSVLMAQGSDQEAAYQVWSLVGEDLLGTYRLLSDVLTTARAPAGGGFSRAVSPVARPSFVGGSRPHMTNTTL